MVWPLGFEPRKKKDRYLWGEPITGDGPAWGGRLICNQETDRFDSDILHQYGVLAHLGERLNGIQKVIGAEPICSTIIICSWSMWSGPTPDKRQMRVRFLQGIPNYRLTIEVKPVNIEAVVRCVLVSTQGPETQENCSAHIGPWWGEAVH